MRLSGGHALLRSRAECIANKEQLMKRKILLVACVGIIIIACLCLTLLVVRYVDIPGTEWDNFLDIRSLIRWELEVKAR